MPPPYIRAFKDLEELSREAAEEFVELAAAAKSKPFAAALSGGSTPKRFYELVATREFSARVRWPRVHFFQVDERCVPPDDARSNYRMMREAMLGQISGVQFHRMRAEEQDREAAAASYEAELRGALGTPPGEWPRLDVIYLGLGEDGHTASLFPGTSALAEQRLAVCANYVPRLEMHRLILTLPALNAAARVIFMASGADKAEILRQALHSPSPPTTPLPAQLVEPAKGTLTWFLDEAAARLL